MSFDYQSQVTPEPKEMTGSLPTGLYCTFHIVFITVTAKKAVDIGINPSSPNIHIQILQTGLHIFPYRIRREIDKRSRHFGSYNFRQTTSSGFKDISRTNYSVQGLRFIQ